LEKFWTDNGLKVLGRTIRKARHERGWSQRYVRDLMQALSRSRSMPECNVTDVTISHIESGKHKVAHNLVMGIAALEFVTHPVTNRPFTSDQLSDIAAEYLDPETGWYCLPPYERPTLSKLLQIEIKNRHPWQGLLFLSRDTQIAVDRLIQLIEEDMPTESEICDLAMELWKSPSVRWTEEELQNIVSLQFNGSQVDLSEQ